MATSKKDGDDFAELPEKSRDALRAAQMYFLQDLTMDAIAREMRTSRSSISRLLSFARDTGLVQITVHSPMDQPTGLQDAIRKTYDVKAHVVPIPDHTTEVDRLERVSLSAGRMLDQFIHSNMTIGIAWGSTISEVSRHLVPNRLHDVQLVQINGAGNMLTSGITYASDILRRFAEAYSATPHQFPVPAFFDDPATKAALWRERSIKRLLGLQQSIHMAIFSVGAPNASVPSHVYDDGYLTPADRDLLQAEHVVGDVATVFYRVDGSFRDIPINARASGLDFDQLRLIPRRIAVVSGVSKLESLRGALAAQLITDLIVDEGTARALVEGPAT